MKNFFKNIFKTNSKYTRVMGQNILTGEVGVFGNYKTEAEARQTCDKMNSTANGYRYYTTKA